MSKSLQEIIASSLTRCQINKYRKDGYVYVIAGISGDKVVDLRYAKTLEEAAELENLVSGSASTMRLSYL